MFIEELIGLSVFAAIASVIVWMIRSEQRALGVPPKPVADEISANAERSKQ